MSKTSKNLARCKQIVECAGHIASFSAVHEEGPDASKIKQHMDQAVSDAQTILKRAGSDTAKGTAGALRALLQGAMNMAHEAGMGDIVRDISQVRKKL